MANKDYDCLIVGAGPAGIFTALRLAEQEGSDLNIAIFDRGMSLEERSVSPDPPILNGWGGSGAFSDGKLTLSRKIGGSLEEHIGKEELSRRLNEVESIYRSFGAPKERLSYGTGKKVENLRRLAYQAGLELVPYRILHCGTDTIREIMAEMYNFIVEEKGVDVYFTTNVEQLISDNSQVSGIKTSKGTFHARNVVFATGRDGSKWLRAEAERHGLELGNNPVDIGVRVEIPADIASPLTDLLYEFKIFSYSPTFDQLVRTFCVCPNGIVSLERGGEIVTVNGHSYSDPSLQTPNTNFAILVSSDFTTPFNEPVLYGQYVSGLANLLSGNKIILQRLSDLKKGRRSTPARVKRAIIEPSCKEAIPGDLSFILPYRHLTSILEMIEALDAVIPGVNSGHTFLYGVETKFYSSKLMLSPDMETQIKGLYCIGDGAGITRSLVQSSASGLIAADSILKQQMNNQIP